MFSKSRTNKAAKPRETLSGAVPSIISADMRVSGDLRTEGDVQVDGVVDGDIQAATLSIGKSAEVNGEVAAETIRVWGKVNGRVRGRDVALMETAKVQGDILHDTLEVARGAQVEGTVKRQAPDEPKQAKVNLVVTGGEATAGGSGRAS